MHQHSKSNTFHHQLDSLPGNVFWLLTQSSSCSLVFKKNVQVWVCFSKRKCEEEKVSWLIVLFYTVLSQTGALAPLWLDITRFHMRAHTQIHTLKGYYSQVQNPSETRAFVNQARLRYKTDVPLLLQPRVIEMQHGWVCMFFLRNSGSVKKKPHVENQ